MSNPDPNKIIFSTRYRYFLNKDRVDGGVSIPSVSVPAFEADKYDLSIPIDDQADFSQVKINYSHDPNDWHIFPCFETTLDSNFNIKVTGAYDSNSLDLSFYVINQTAAPHNNTATTVSVRVHPFEPPI